MTRASKAPGSSPRGDPCKAGYLERRESSRESVYALKYPPFTSVYFQYSQSQIRYLLALNSFNISSSDAKTTEKATVELNKHY